MMERKLIPGTLVVATLVAVGMSAAEPADPGPLLMNHAMESLSGEAASLMDFEGEVLVVNFWASWCAPCLRELPILDRWNENWRQAGARVVAVSIDQKAANARTFVAKQGLSLTVLIDGPDGLARQLDLPAVPTTYVIDRNGRVVLRIEGSGEKDLEKMRTMVESLLGDVGRGPGA